MKLTLIILGCFVCVSRQERYIWPLPVSPSQAIYKPLFYGDGLPAGYDVIKKTEEEQKSDAISRSNSPQQNRLFFTGLNLFTTTVVVTSPIVSTITTATVVKCVPAAQFATTSACSARRKRRAVLEDILEADSINPAPPKPLVPSAAVFESSRKIEDSVLATPEIISSQKEEPSDLSNIAYNPRAGLGTTTITSIAYTTSYQFKATALTSTISLGVNTGLICLPSGYTICA